jgi:hypothetical protein
MPYQNFGAINPQALREVRLPLLTFISVCPESVFIPIFPFHFPRRNLLILGIPLLIEMAKDPLGIVTSFTPLRTPLPH